MAKENSFGLINQPTMETSSRIISTEKANTDGLMAEFITANGLIIRWRERVLSPGVMEEGTLETTKMIRSTATEPLNGQMVENILESGVRVSNTEKEFTLKKVRRDKVSGRWERE